MLQDTYTIKKFRLRAIGSAVFAGALWMAAMNHPTKDLGLSVVAAGFSLQALYYVKVWLRASRAQSGDDLSVRR